MAKTGAAPPEITYDFSVLRELRKQASLTLNEVSDRSGVSLAVISKLERNQSQAGLDTLYRLARVFGMRAADLIDLAESGVSQKSSAVAYHSGDFDFQRLDYHLVNVFIGEAPAGGEVRRPEVHRDDYEVCWVLEGVLSIRLSQETHLLRDGQSILFDAIQEHTYEAIEACRLIILHLRKKLRG
jgi:transcriptional regulator with XRE-family HTH domain